MSAAPRLPAHRDLLAALRFCPMAAPAGETVAVTRLETHAIRARTLMLWQIAAGLRRWTPRAAEVIHECTLDGVSEAYDPYHPPIATVMLDARADAWEAGVAPDPVRRAIAALARHAAVRWVPAATAADCPPPAAADDAAPHAPGAVLVAGELAVAGRNDWLAALPRLLARCGPGTRALLAPTGALPLLLGERALAAAQADALLEALHASGATRVHADGPETEWMLRRGLAALGRALPARIAVEPWLDAVAGQSAPVRCNAPVFVHDARAAYPLADVQPSARVVMPGFDRQPGADESECGDGEVYRAPRRAVARGGLATVWGTWCRALAKSSGADDGLWLAAPPVAAALARARLRWVRGLGARVLVTDSVLAAAWLQRHAAADDPAVAWLPLLLAENA